MKVSRSLLRNIPAAQAHEPARREAPWRERSQGSRPSAATLRAGAKALILGAVGARLLVGAPAAWWESSTHRGPAALMLDAAWVVGLTALPPLTGWGRRAAWKGAPIIAATALGGGAAALALAQPGAVADRADLALRLARLAAESVAAVGVLAITGPWLAPTWRK